MAKYRYYRDLENKQEVCEKLVGTDWVECRRIPLNLVKKSKQTIRSVDPYVWLDFVAYCEYFGLTQSEGLAHLIENAREEIGELASGGSPVENMAGSRLATTPLFLGRNYRYSDAEPTV